MNLIFVPIAAGDIAPARALRTAFARFWSTSQGGPREVYDRFIAATPIVPGVVTRPALDDANPGWWCEPEDAQADRAILFLHGGGYGLGHAEAYVGFVSQIVSRVGVTAFALEYPLAPEAQLPTALDLAVETLAQLAKRFKRVAVVGDSAGGGLSLATVIDAKQRGLPVSSVVVFSPWTDLSLSGESTRAHAVGDPLLDVGYLRRAAANYAGKQPLTDPRASPLFASDLHLPPTLIQVGTDEVLLDDARRFAQAASDAGTELVLEQWQGMHHVFQLNTQELLSARRALDNVAAFIGRHWAP